MSDNQTVFVVDDDAAAAASVAALMSSAGLRSEVFHSAEAFLDSYDGVRPGCLLLDVRLGGKMSGLQLHQLLRQRGTNLPTILISGHVDAQTTDHQDAEGVVACLEKPYGGDDLCNVVKSALDAT